MSPGSSSAAEDWGLDGPVLGLLPGAPHGSEERVLRLYHASLHSSAPGLILASSVFMSEFKGSFILHLDYGRSAIHLTVSADPLSYLASDGARNACWGQVGGQGGVWLLQHDCCSLLVPVQPGCVPGLGAPSRGRRTRVCPGGKVGAER